jgi:peptidoglycan/LPS O-acetylase OafA/YrhL
LTGGYIGVDVFFVISGYLISRIIMRGLNDRAFRFAIFYRNRVTRILPALLIVVAATYLFGWFTLMPGEFGQLGKQIAASMGFVQNFMLWQESGYFDTASASKPLLHLWSLSIEEQFYVIYPLCLWAAWRAGRNIRILIALVLSVSLCFNLIGIDGDAAGTFYLPQTRFWELLAGGLLATQRDFRQSAIRERPPRILPGLSIFDRLPTSFGGHAVVGEIAAALGLGIVVVSACVLTDATPFPGWRAMLPVGGTCLVISAGPSAWCSRVLLANRTMVRIGLISYPLYLWHWPMLSYLRLLEGPIPSPATRSAVVILSIGLAWLTYRFIERPIRLGRPNRFRVAMLCEMAVLLGIVGAVTSARHGLNERPVVRMNPGLATGRVEGGLNFVADGCRVDGDSAMDGFLWCRHDTRGTVRFALLGDSKAAALSQGIFRQPVDRGSWLFMGAPFFAPLASSADIYAAYQPMTEASLAEIIANTNIKLVVLTLASRSLFALKNDTTIEDMPSSPNFDTALTALGNTVDRFVIGGKKIVITVDNPTLIDPAFCLARVTALGPINNLIGMAGSPAGCTIGLDRQLELSAQYRKLLGAIAARYPRQVRLFETFRFLCDMQGRLCSSSMNGRALYSFSDHISDYSAVAIARALVPFAEDFADQP